MCVCFDTFQVGCDRSSALIQICAERGFQAFVSDALSVPLRSATCDACISIAVIHHFSTQVSRTHVTHACTLNAVLLILQRLYIRAVDYKKTMDR